MNQAPTVNDGTRIASLKRAMLDPSVDSSTSAWPFNFESAPGFDSRAERCRSHRETAALSPHLLHDSAMPAPLCPARLRQAEATGKEVARAQSRLDLRRLFALSKHRAPSTKAPAGSCGARPQRNGKAVFDRCQLGCDCACGVLLAGPQRGSCRFAFRRRFANHDRLGDCTNRLCELQRFS